MNKRAALDSRQMQERQVVATAREQFTTGKVAEAEATLERLLAANPKNVEARTALGIIAAETGRLDVAIQRLTLALRTDPRWVPALCWMSFLQLHTGNIEDSRKCAERAVALAPNHAAGHASLARALLAQGRRNEAIASFRRSLEFNSQDAALMYELAQAQLDAKFEREAADTLRKAVRLAPEPNAFLNLAGIELTFGKLQDAETFARCALELAPDVAAAHVIMGKILTQQLKVEEADGHWRRATELDPYHNDFSLQRALAFAAAGQFESTLQNLDRSIAEQPVQGGAYRAKVFAKRVGSDDLPLVHQMEKLLEVGELTENENLDLLYSLGKSYDNLGDYEQAIGYYDRANALKTKLRGGEPFSPAAFTALVDQRIRLFSADFFASWNETTLDTSLPILIVGMMRSGTTLAEQMLSCHPKVGGAGEQRFWARNEHLMVDYDMQAVQASRLRRFGKEYVELLTSIAPGFPFVIDKNPANLLFLGSLYLAFPNAKIIRTRRHPIDTALSIWMTPMSTEADFVGVRENIVHAIKECERLMEHWREVLPSDRLLEVRYEDLVADPESGARKMLEFCGLEWNPACLHPELNQRRITTPSFWQVRQPIYKSSTDRWKNYEPWLGTFGDLPRADGPHI